MNFRSIKRGIAMILAVILVCCLCVSAFAEGDTPATKFNEGNLVVDVKAAEDEYTFYSIYRAPGHAYEMSYHMLSANGGEHNDIPQTLLLLDATEDHTWSPNGIYAHGKANYEVLYCCDAVTGYEDSVYYKRMNLEDSAYYTQEQARKIRAIVMNSYPYITLEQMKEDLKAEGFADAEQLTRADIIAAVQAAIWAYANLESGSYVYSQTFDIATNTQWGTVLHDYTAEMDVWWQTGKRKFSTDEATQKRIDSLIAHLKARDSVSPEPEQIIITDLQIVKAVSWLDLEDTFTTTLRVELNSSGSGEQDALKLDIYVDGVLARTEEVRFGVDVYECEVATKIGQTIHAVVSGTQVVPEGAYFYEPKGGREVSQCLVGIASGETTVWAESSIEVPDTTQVQVTKIWNDDNNSSGLRPASALIRLYADGVEVATAQLSEESGWSWVFEDLKIYREDGMPVVYTITEDDIDGYQTTVDGYNVTNTLVPEEDPPTGDGSPALLLWAVVSLLCLALLVSRRRTFLQ